MRRFTADYLERTRRGMWESREALAPLALDSRSRVLDVGCGTGELTRVLAEEAPAAEVVGVDADTGLLASARDATEGTGVAARTGYAAGDATRLPFPDDAFDLVACQALLINLPDPAAAVREFARVSTDLVAAVEPDNADVAVSSTVDAEARLEAEVRAAYIAGVDTDVAMGERARDLFADAGLTVVDTHRYRHEKRVEPPYSEADLRGVARKASGAGIADHETELRRELAAGDYDRLRREWREMGRAAAAQAQDGDYERVERVPFDVTVGRV
ncbi:class I SAM-dependent methyltransferase [Halobaculum litoreum]|uniref:class I SAM-dependent methyltransferase n=1 Tax=Halobaculum litoreum TaxID=3031998 RepID=UPI0024C41AB6|nr:class I SAM-dependent methyltransferase [Halobaculum sp. DT92]